MRICLLADGDEVHILRLTDYLAERGHEVHLVCGHTQNIYHHGVQVHRLAGKRNTVFNFLYRLAAVKKIIGEIQPQVVDGHFLVTYAFLAACSGFHPLVATAWGSDILTIPWRNPLRRFYSWYSLKKADRINCLFSLDIAREKFLRLGADLSRVRTYYLGVDPREFERREDTGGIRQELGIGPADPLVLNPRGLAPVYGVATFIRAIPLILEQLPCTKFILIYKDGEEGLAQELSIPAGCAQSVKILPWQPRSRLPLLLSASQVYVSCSLSDTASNALFEAMACESAAAVSDIPANRHWIRDGENGFLFPPGDYRRLAERVVSLLKQADLRASFGQQCRAIVIEKANQNVEMPAIEKIYREVTGESA